MPNTKEVEQAEYLEQVASNVHDSWWNQKKENGFHAPSDCDSENRRGYNRSDWQGQSRFDEHFNAKFYKWCDKCHPDMYPYNELSENVKDYDRTTVKTVLKAMEALSPLEQSEKNPDLPSINESYDKIGIDYSMEPSQVLEQSEKKEEWVSVTEYNKLKDSFEELLSATVKMLYSGNHDKSAEITKNVWREKAGLPSPLTPCKH